MLNTNSYLSIISKFSIFIQRIACFLFRFPNLLLGNFEYSLSRREESRKHKLFACLLVCPHFTDWSKEQCENEWDNFIKHLTKGNRG